MTDNPGGGVSDAFPWIFGAFVVIILCGFLLVGFTIARNRRTLRRAGIDPGTASSQLAVRLLNSQALAPQASAEQRLAELTGLRDRGLITEEEYQTRRRQIIEGI
jgi:hypothetical protein